MDGKAREFMRFEFTDTTRDVDGALVFGWKNMFVTMWREVFTLMKANVIFLICCIPIVTIPCAITALHGSCIDAIRGNGSKVTDAFKKTFRYQFFQSWFLFLSMIVLEFIAIYGTWFYFRQNIVVLRIFGVAMCVVAVVGYLMIPYAFCMLSKFDLSLMNVLKNSFLMVFLNLNQQESELMVSSYRFLLLLQDRS